LTDRSKIAKVGYRLADPISTLRRLDREIRIVGERAIQADQFKNTLANVGLDLAYLDHRTSSNFGTRMPRESKRWSGRLVERIGRAQN
jgi:hypothetical protein